MGENEVTIWGIHGGRTGDADSIFLKKNYVAIGWHQMGNLGLLAPNREAFKAKVAETYPDAKPGAIPSSAGQTYRFVHEMKPSDLIVYPSKRDRQIHIGRIEGGYKYDPGMEQTYPNLRPVRWLRALPRTHFSQGSLYEIGSAMSLFQVKNYAESRLLWKVGLQLRLPRKMRLSALWPRISRKPLAISSSSAWLRN